MIKVHDIHSALSIVSSLIENNYLVTIKAVYKEFPRVKEINYYEINYELAKGE